MASLPTSMDVDSRIQAPASLNACVSAATWTLRRRRRTTLPQHPNTMFSFTPSSTPTVFQRAARSGSVSAHNRGLFIEEVNLLTNVCNGAIDECPPSLASLGIGWPERLHLTAQRSIHSLLPTKLGKHTALRNQWRGPEPGHRSIATSAPPDAPPSPFGNPRKRCRRSTPTLQRGPASPCHHSPPQPRLRP